MFKSILLKETMFKTYSFERGKVSNIFFKKRQGFKSILLKEAIFKTYLFEKGILLKKAWFRKVFFIEVSV